MDVFIISEKGIIPLLQCSILDAVKDPTCICFAEDGNVYVTSYEYHCLHVLNEDGQPTRAAVGQHGKKELQFMGPKQVAVHDGKVYVMESLAKRIQVLTTGNHFESFFGLSFAPGQKLIPPSAFCVGPNGYLYIASEHRSVCVYHPSGLLMHTFDTKITRSLTGITLDAQGNVHVGSHWGIKVFSPDGDHLRDYANEQWVTAVIVTSEGLSLVSSKGCLSVYSSCGQLICHYRGQFYPHHVAVATDGSVWLACVEGILILPQLYLPPFSLRLLCHQAVLLQMDRLPVSLLPPAFNRMFSEWSHPLNVEVVDNDEEVVRSVCIRMKQGIPLPVVFQFVRIKMDMTVNCAWFKGSVNKSNRLSLRDGTLNEDWKDVLVKL